jgi:membrane dipeptidase
MSRVQVSSAPLGSAVRSQEAAYAIGQSHLAYYQALDRLGEIRLIRDAKYLEACLADWRKPGPETPVGVIISMESADPILGPDQVREWWEAGLRSVSLTHFGANTWGHGTGTRGGLYPNAYPLLDALLEAGVVLDITHAADRAFWQLMEYWQGPVHASHCCCRALIHGQRHLSDEMIKALVERNGVIGLVCAEQMLSPDWDWDDPSTHRTTATRSLSALVEHVDHICQLVGDCEHVAIGSDLDGGFGRELSPIDLDTIADLQKLPGILANRGYRQKDIEKIAHGNIVDFFRRAWRKK